MNPVVNEKNLRFEFLDFSVARREVNIFKWAWFILSPFLDKFSLPLGLTDAVTVTNYLRQYSEHARWGQWDFFLKKLVGVA